MAGIKLNVFESQLKPETLEYFRKIQSEFDEMSRGAVESDAFLRLVENVFNETKDNEEALLLNRHTSFTMQKILQQTKNIEGLTEFLRAIYKRFIALSRGRFASHPIQVLVNRIPEIIIKYDDTKNGNEKIENIKQKSEEKIAKKQKITPLKMVNKIFKDFKKHFEAMIMCPFGSFIARDLVKLSHIIFEKNILQHEEKKSNQNTKIDGKNIKISVENNIKNCDNNYSEKIENFEKIANLTIKNGEINDKINKTKKINKIEKKLKKIEKNKIKPFKKPNSVLRHLAKILISYLKTKSENQLLKNATSMPLITCILENLAVEENFKLVDKIIKTFLKVPSTVPNAEFKKSFWLLSQNKTSSFFVQAAIKNCSEKIFERIFSAMENDLLNFALSDSANFVLQAVLDRENLSREKIELFNQILTPEMESILSKKRHILFCKLSKKLQGNRKNEKMFFKEILRLFEVNNKNLILSILHNFGDFKSKKKIEKDKENEKENLKENKSKNEKENSNKKPAENEKSHSLFGGSMIIKSLLKFSQGIISPLILSFRSLNNSDLVWMATQKHSSDILVEFFQTPFAFKNHLKSKFLVAKTLQGKYVRLSNNIFGSFVVESIMKFALEFSKENSDCSKFFIKANKKAIKKKNKINKNNENFAQKNQLELKILAELKRSNYTLNNNRFGRYIASKCDFENLKWNG